MRIDGHEPALQRIIGVTERRYDRWCMIYESRRFWCAWLNAAPSMISAEAIPAGAVRYHGMRIRH